MNSPQPDLHPFAVARTLGFLLLLTLGSTAFGQSAVDLSASTTSFTVAPGGTFSFTLNLVVSGSDQVSGVSYWFDDDTTSADDFSITGRNIGASVMDFTTTSNGTALASPGNELLPANAYDLGGGTIDESAVGTGTYLLATYTFTVAANAPLGTYSIVTGSSQSGSGAVWAGAGPSYTASPFNQEADLTVQVVPEPATYAWLLGVAGLAYAVWSRKSARRTA